MTYFFLEGPWENAQKPTICKEDPAGGDPHILAVLARVHRAEELLLICQRANLPTAEQARAKVIAYIRGRDWLTDLNIEVMVNEIEQMDFATVDAPPETS